MLCAFTYHVTGHKNTQDAVSYLSYDAAAVTAAHSNISSLHMSCLAVSRPSLSFLSYSSLR